MRALTRNTPATHWEQEQTEWRGKQDDHTLRMVLQRKEDEERKAFNREMNALFTRADGEE